MKTTVALSVGTEIFVSQHIGDLETAAAHAAFRQTAADLPRLYDATPEGVACDLHPDYLSTQFAAHLAAPSCPVQHHFAHVLACMAENELDPPALGVAWDGTGFGMDGTIWGGEFLLARGSGFERVGHLRPFRLPGGDAAARQPRRAALGILFEIFGDALWDRDEWHTAFTQPEARLLRQMLAKHINTPLTSSAGRLFDAVASLAGLRHQCAFEGQAAMELEFAADPDVTEPYPFEIRPGPPHIIDWQPMILALLDDLRRGFGPRAVSARFHNTLAEIIVAIARKAGEQTVVLTGGCFQNRLLTERAVARLRAAGFEPYWHRHIPPNDGGIAPGQIIGAALAMRHQTA
jgi:hydrogenase maturation protein HypF